MMTVVAVVVTTAVAVEVARARGNQLGRVAVAFVWRWWLSGGGGQVVVAVDWR